MGGVRAAAGAGALVVSTEALLGGGLTGGLTGGVVGRKLSLKGIKEKLGDRLTVTVTFTIKEKYRRKGILLREYRKLMNDMQKKYETTNQLKKNLEKPKRSIGR